MQVCGYQWGYGGKGQAVSGHSYVRNWEACTLADNFVIAEQRVPYHIHIRIPVPIVVHRVFEAA